MASSEERLLSQDEILTRIHEVVAEVRAALRSDAWGLLPRGGTVPSLHSAAGLSHCCHLAEEIIQAHERGAEMVGRILARSLFETWLHAYYIQLGGLDAFEAVIAAHADQLRKQNAALTQHDKGLVVRRRDVRRRNRKIAKTNAGIEIWNQQNPERDPKPLLELIPEPPGVRIGWTTPTGPSYQVPPQGLPLTTIIERVRKLTRDAGQEETFEAGYHLAYRGLSNLGAHANLFVLNSYLDDRDGEALIVRVREQAVVPSSFDKPNLSMTLLMTAGLAVAVLAARGSTCERSQEALERFTEVFGRTDDQE